MPVWNAIAVARACCAGLAGLALVIVSASLAAADFGPRTTIGKNYQQWSNTESANGTAPGTCTGSFCFVLFQRIPQQQPLIVQHVACRAAISAGGLEFVYVGTRKGGGGFPLRSTPLVPVFTTTDPSPEEHNWVVNSPAMHLLKSGERPVVYFQGTEAAEWGVACSVSGKLQ